MKVFFLTCAIIALTIFSCTKDVGQLTKKAELGCDTISFAADVNPIIAAKCATTGCHEANFTSGDYTTYAGIKLKVDNGTFNNRVFVVQDMPLTPSPPLTSAELEILRCWYNSGAPNN